MAVEVCVIVAAVTDKLESGAVLPIAPVKVVVPVPPVIVKLCAPFNVLPKDTFALFEVMLLVAVMLTGSGKLKGLAPDTVIFAPIWIALALVKVMLVGALVPPTMPSKATTPVPALSVSATAPLSVLEKLILLPAALVSIVTGFVMRLTGLGKVSGFAPVTVILL